MSSSALRPTQHKQQHHNHHHWQCSRPRVRAGASLMETTLAASAAFVRRLAHRQKAGWGFGESEGERQSLEQSVGQFCPACPSLCLSNGARRWPERGGQRGWRKALTRTVYTGQRCCLDRRLPVAPSASGEGTPWWPSSGGPPLQKAFFVCSFGCQLACCLASNAALGLAKWCLLVHVGLKHVVSSWTVCWISGMW